MYDLEAIKTKIKGAIEGENGDTFIKATISNPIQKRADAPFKITLTKIMLKGTAYLQVTSAIQNKVLHDNIVFTPNVAIDKILTLMQENFKQCTIVSSSILTLLMNKKREFSLTSILPNDGYTAQDVRSHNAPKHYILKEGEYIHWLYQLGICTESGKVVASMQKKFRQINKFLEMLADVSGYIPDDAVIVDMGCGKSYLTFAMYHYFNHILHKHVRIKGFDLKTDVVAYCNQLATDFGFRDLTFFDQDIATLDTVHEKVDMMITLHACDTATDYAIYHGIKWNCRVILTVPCCQHELFNQIQNDALDLLLTHGILKERFSALLTDSFRAAMLDAYQYKTNVIEFIDMEHTPKNIMIKAIKKDGKKIDGEKINQLEKTMRDFHITPTIYTLLTAQNE